MIQVNLKLIKDLRKRNNFSQSTLAESLNISLYKYNRKENGKQAFEAVELKSIADTFNEDIENFFIL